MIDELPHVSLVGSCGSIAEAQQLIERESPDLVLLDINLSDGNGFELIDLYEESIPFQVVFITAYNVSEYAIRALRLGALDYLPKPFSKGDLSGAIDKAILNRELNLSLSDNIAVARSAWQAKKSGAPRKLIVRSRLFQQIVTLEEIVYGQAVGNYTKLMLKNKAPVVSSTTLGDMNELLSSAGEFFRVHRSYLVNTDYIDRIHNDGYLLLATGDEVPYSGSQKESLLHFMNSKYHPVNGSRKNFTS